MSLPDNSSRGRASLDGDLCSAVALGRSSLLACWNSGAWVGGAACFAFELVKALRPPDRGVKPKPLPLFFTGAVIGIPSSGVAEQQRSALHFVVDVKKAVGYSRAENEVATRCYGSTKMGSTK